MRLPSLSLVLGGASSGKSSFAESLVSASNFDKIYLATAQPFDAEMEEKISKHQLKRLKNNWKTIEAPIDICSEIEACGSSEAILLDCLTLWLTNLITGEADWKSELNILVKTIKKTPAPVVIVSNELSGGITPDNALARRFQRVQGLANQEVARAADLVVLVTAGIPQVLKGDLQPGDLP